MLLKIANFALQQSKKYITAYTYKSVQLNCPWIYTISWYIPGLMDSCKLSLDFGVFVSWQMRMWNRMKNLHWRLGWGWGDRKLLVIVTLYVWAKAVGQLLQTNMIWMGQISSLKNIQSIKDKDIDHTRPVQRTRMIFLIYSTRWYCPPRLLTIDAFLALKMHPISNFHKVSQYDTYEIYNRCEGNRYFLIFCIFLHVGFRCIYIIVKSCKIHDAVLGVCLLP